MIRRPPRSPLFPYTPLFRSLPAYPTLREQPVSDPAVPRMELPDWAERYGVVAGITTRGSGRGFSLGLWSEENVGQVMTRWRGPRAPLRPPLPGAGLTPPTPGTPAPAPRARQ